MSQDVEQQSGLSEHMLTDCVGSVEAEATLSQHDLITTYYGFVETVVVRLMRAMGLPFALKDEFMSAGALGLVEAAGRFKPERGTPFRIFAFLRIRGAVIDHIRSSCELSGEAYRMFRSLAAAQELREIELDNHGTVSPFASKAHKAGRAIEYLSKTALAFSLYGTPPEATPTAAETPEQELEKKQSSKQIHDFVATLPAKERIIIEQHYFHDRSLVEIADNYAGLSKSWVSRLHDRALGLLREKIEEARRELLPHSSVSGSDSASGRLARKRLRGRDRARSRRGRGKSRS
jgi:RNA polymerase sigma factor for flagellar operon FliA